MLGLGLLLLGLLAATVDAWVRVGVKTFELEDGTLVEFPNPKFFSEPREISDHYDSEFMVRELPEDEKKNAIKTLVQTYLSTMQDLHVRTWLMHGSLLGWWWGKKVMPWDYDADVQVNEADMYYLAAYYNMTTYYFKYGDMKKGKNFLLRINPYFTYRGIDDVLNVIDARWVDMDNGLYIDITAARYNLESEDGEGMLYDKHDHEYRDSYIYPLRQTSFEGVPAWVPFDYRSLLESEYGTRALTSRHFRGHEFDKEEQQWKSDGLSASPGWKQSIVNKWYERHGMR